MALGRLPTRGLAGAGLRREARTLLRRCRGRPGRARLGDQLLLHRLEPLGTELRSRQALLLDVLLEVRDPVRGRRVVREVLGERRLVSLHRLQLLEELDDAVWVVPCL